MDGVFVTGTGTEVGKTIVAGVIARTALGAGHRVSVFKPAVSGLDEASEQGVAPDHEHLRSAAGSRQTDDEISPYRYAPAVSPHLAAELEGTEIDAGAPARAGSPRRGRPATSWSARAWAGSSCRFGSTIWCATSRGTPGCPWSSSPLPGSARSTTRS